MKQLSVVARNADSRATAKMPKGRFEPEPQPEVTSPLVVLIYQQVQITTVDYCMQLMLGNVVCVKLLVDTEQA